MIFFKLKKVIMFRNLKIYCARMIKAAVQNSTFGKIQFKDLVKCAPEYTGIMA